MITLNDILNAVIDDGTSEMRLVYTAPRHRIKLEGGIAGFEACRGKEPAEIGRMLVDARERSRRAREIQAADYWYHRYYEAEVEWVANVLSVALVYLGQQPIAEPTVRGHIKYAEILGLGVAGP